MNRARSTTLHAVGGRAPWSWAFGGALLGLLISLLSFAPARWLTQALQQATQGRMAFQEVRGTVWRGSAALTLTGGPGSQDAATLPGRLDWELRPAWTGLQAMVLADCCMQQGWHLQVQPQWGGASLRFSDSLSQWPAQWLSGLGTPWNTLQFTGQLLLTTQGLALQWTQGRLAVAGNARLDAQHMGSRLSTLQPMGSYRLQLKGGATPGFSLETLEGSLQLSGQGQWVGNRLRFEGVATAAPDRLEALSNLLNILGRRDGARSLIKVG